MIGLKDQTVRGANSFADARAKHRWQIPADYKVRAIAALLESSSKRGPKKGVKRPKATGKRRGGITPEGRQRLSLAMKKRWAERKTKKS
jgi:hypothetical protein